MKFKHNIMTFCIVKRFVTDRKPQPYTCRNPNMSILVGGRGVDCNYTTQNFTQKIKRISIQMLKKNCHLVLGFGVTKIETRAHFQNNRCKQPTSRPPPKRIGLIEIEHRLLYHCWSPQLDK